MENLVLNLSNEAEHGKLGIAYLKTIWLSTWLQKNGSHDDKIETKPNYTSALFDALGIGMEPAFQYLYGECESFDDFENWILANGNISQEMIVHFNFAINSKEQLSENFRIEEPVLTKKMLKQWDEEGYVILPNAISKEDCEASVDAIHDFLKIDQNDSSSWYQPHEARKGIMVQLFRHKVLDQNRYAPKIQKAFQQVWKRNALTVSMDRVSFNPPETENYKFPGPDLHWDISLYQPIPFGTQGLLYLSDTTIDQGAFTLVPGFHRKIDSWLDSLPKNVNPRTYDLHQFGSKPIAAEAGDFILWNQMLPHGSSPNSGNKPRIVQYINYQPLEREVQSSWI